MEDPGNGTDPRIQKLKEFFLQPYTSGLATIAIVVLAIAAFAMLMYHATKVPPPQATQEVPAKIAAHSEPMTIRATASKPEQANVTALIAQAAQAPKPTPPKEESPTISFVLLMTGDRAVLYEAARGPVEFKDGVISYTSTEGRERRFLGGSALHSKTPLPFNGAALVRSNTGRIFKVD